MRIMVFFDLSTITAANKRDYRKFRKYLVKSGFLMLQESVYCKLTLNTTNAEAVAEGVRKNKPPQGLVQMLIVTEKQFSKMEYILGESRSDILETDERLVVL